VAGEWLAGRVLEEGKFYLCADYFFSQFGKAMTTNISYVQLCVTNFAVMSHQRLVQAEPDAGQGAGTIF
jgi:hypothetical protein